MMGGKESPCVDVEYNHSEGKRKMIHNAIEDAHDGVVTADSRAGGNDWDVLFIPNTIKSIRKGAYKGATNIREIQCENGDSPLTIYEGAFEGCASLQVVELPSRVETIQDRSFARCMSLDDFRIVGDSHLHCLQHGFNVFDGCDNLKHIYVQEDFLKILDDNDIEFINEEYLDEDNDDEELDDDQIIEYALEYMGLSEDIFEVK